MAALEDVLNRDFVRRFLVEQKTTCNPFSKFHTKTKNEKENENPFFKSYRKKKNGEHKVNSNSVSLPAGKIEK